MVVQQLRPLGYNKTLFASPAPTEVKAKEARASCLGIDPEGTDAWNLCTTDNNIASEVHQREFDMWDANT